MLCVALLAAGAGKFVLGLSSLDPSPALLPFVRMSGARVYLVALPWRLVEPETLDLKGLSVKRALGDEALLEEYSRRANWSEADELISAILRAGVAPIVGVGWGWRDMVPRFEGGPFCPDYAGYERYRAHFVLHVRAVVERYDGDGHLDAPGSPRVEMWLPERALNEAVAEAALGKREPSVFSAPYSAWVYWNFLDMLMHDGISAVKAANGEALVGALVQTDVPELVSAYVGKPTWDGALAGWAPDLDFVVLETFPNAWLPEPLKPEVVGKKVEGALKVSEGKPVYVLTGYPSGPPELGYSEELQAEFLRRAVEAARRAGAAGLIWHTVRSEDGTGVKPTPQDVADLRAIGRSLEAGDISPIISMAISEPQRTERLLKVAGEMEKFAGLVRADGSGKPAWGAFLKAAREM